jgi:UPF0755 protein
VKKLLLLVVLVAGCGFGASRGVDYYNYEVYTPISSHSDPVNFTVQTGESPSQIGADLQDKRLIRSQDFFNLYLKLSGTRGELQAGDFVLNRNMDIPHIVDALQHGRTNQLAVRVPEALPIKFVAQALEKAGFTKAQDYIDAANDPAWKGQYAFLAGVPAGRNPLLEGYLYPDTYLLNRGATAHDLVKAQLDAFAKLATPDLTQAIGQKTAARQAMTLDQLVTMASITDLEVNKAPEKPRVCEVFYNRLAGTIPLGSDATIEYAIGEYNKPLTVDDLKVNSPYNTRTHFGLPPGPVGNPVAGAIQACANPEQGDYLFFFTDKSGVTHFEKTEAEFQADMAKYGVSGG